jgi:predicted helicase
MGIKSNRDDWVYSFSEKTLRARIAGMIDFYNSEVVRYKEAGERDGADGFVSRDKTKIKWTSDVLADLENGRERTVDSTGFVKSMYRPFTKEWVYSNKVWNWSRHLMHTYFPTGTTENRVICVTGTGETTGFSALMGSVQETEIYVR